MFGYALDHPPCRLIDDTGSARGPYMSEPRKAFLLRMNVELWRDLEAWAQEEFRSVNGQIEFLLRDAARRRRGKQLAAVAKTAGPVAEAEATLPSPTLPPDTELEMGRHD